MDEKELGQIDWYDAQSCDPWTSEPIDYKPFLVSTVGWITEFDDGYVVTPNHSADWSDEPFQRFGDVHIPRGCVHQIYRLKKVKNDGKA